jgi:hypothetical protein
MKQGHFLLVGCAIVQMLCPSALHAWWEGGHKAVALIAYERLTQVERDWVMSLLDAVPTQEQLFTPLMQKELGPSPDKDARARWFFAQASIWPDLVRNSAKNPALSQIKIDYDRPLRHYTDLPVFATEADRKALPDKDVGPDMKWSAGMAEPKDGFNSMQTFARILKEIPDSGIEAGKRAVDMCWLFHLIGDTHQPCHCAQLFVPKKLPDGDRGGNDVHVLGAKSLGRGLNKDALHGVWDSYLNDVTNTLASVTANVEGLKKEPALWQNATTAAAVTDPIAWLREGHALAQKHVYNPLLLKYVDKTQAVLQPNGKPAGLALAFTVDDLKKYEAGSNDIARQQIVTAGVRLAETLKVLAAKSK